MPSNQKPLQNTSRLSFTLRFPLLLFICLALVVSGGSHLVYEWLKQNETRIIEENLAAIANLKVGQIADWVRQNKINADVTAKYSALATTAERWISEGARPGPDQIWLLNRLEFIRDKYQLGEMTILDAVGKPRLSTSTSLPDLNQQQAALLLAIDQQQSVLGEMHLDIRADGEQFVSFPIAAPLIPTDSRKTVIGTLLVVIDANHFLFPLIQTWPTSSQTAETLLVKQDGNEVLFLNELRHKKDTALKMRFPIDHPTILAAQAVRGATGFIRGVDYRDKPVIGYALKVPETDWFMIAKIDQEEMYTSIRQLATAVAAVTLALFLISALLLYVWWRQRVTQYQTAQLRGELDQQFQKQQYEYLSRYANDIILLMDNNAIIVDANDRAETSFGFDRSELIGKKLTELQTQLNQDLLNQRWQLLLEKKSLIIESQFLRRDGTQFPVEVSARAIERGEEAFIQCIMRDISDRKAAQAREQLITNMYRALGEINNAIVHVESEPELFSLVCQIAVNYGGMKLAWIGTPSEEHRFFPVAQFGKATDYLKDIRVAATPDSPEGRGPAGVAYREKRAVIVNDISIESSIAPWSKRSAEYGIKAIASFPILRNGNSYAVLTVYNEHKNAFDEEIVQLLNEAATNVSFALDSLDRETERKQAEEQLRVLTLTLEERVRERTAKLEAANKELEAFSYSVSHDLRAPLRGIDGFSRLLLERHAGKLDASGQDYLNRIKNAARRMSLLIDDMLRLSRIGRTEIRKTMVNLTEMASSVANDMRQRESERKIEIVIAPDLMANADAGLLRIVLENLLGNAFKFTGKKDDARIEVGAMDKDDERIYYVRDNGVGFDMAYAEKLFSPFQRLHGDTEFAGSGIGLASVQRIITRHGGRIWPEAKEGQGATFFFTLGE